MKLLSYDWRYNGFWADERFAIVETGYNWGRPTADIATDVGVTKNAVIGVARRTGLVHPHPHHPNHTIPTLAVEQYPAHAAMMSLEGKGRKCRWPLGHPDQEGFRFCLSPHRTPDLPWSPYCPEHSAIAYMRKTPDGR